MNVAKAAKPLWLKRQLDMREFRKILHMQSDSKRYKQFFNKDGCGLEIEFGINYTPFDSRYVKTGLEKLADIVQGYGKFVPDVTVMKDFNVEVVLNPLEHDELQRLFGDIMAIINCYDNFIIDEHSGVHANFLADQKLKEKFYYSLCQGNYNSSKFIHNKFKVDFWEVVTKKADGSIMTFDEYMDYQNRIAGKYLAVNFLKENIIEFRSLDYTWETISYVIGLYESVAMSVDTAVESEMIENPAFV